MTKKLGYEFYLFLKKTINLSKNERFMINFYKLPEWYLAILLVYSNSDC